LLRELFAQTPEHLKSGGLLLLEIGAGQAPAVKALIEQTGAFEAIEFIDDYAGIARVAKAIRK
jgi:release factor glutamine methyltransferase